MKTNLRVLAKTERGRKNKKRTGDNHRLAQERKTLLGKNKAAGKSLTREQEKLRRQTENQVKTRSALCTRERKIFEEQQYARNRKGKFFIVIKQLHNPSTDVTTIPSSFDYWNEK
jgi:hypothetical protein